MIPELPPLPVNLEGQELNAYAMHLLCTYADLMEHLYLYQIPNELPANAFPLTLEHYILFDDIRQKTRLLTLNFPNKKASAPSQSAPASTA